MNLVLGDGDPGAAAAGGIFLFFVFAILGIMAAGLYFVPSIIAFARNKSNKIAILALNFFLGWSVLGWVIAMVWALANEEPPQQVIVYHQTPPAAAPATLSPPPSSVAPPQLPGEEPKL